MCTASLPTIVAPCMLVECPANTLNNPTEMTFQNDTKLSTPIHHSAKTLKQLRCPVKVPHPPISLVVSGVQYPSAAPILAPDMVGSDLLRKFQRAPLLTQITRKPCLFRKLAHSQILRSKRRVMLENLKIQCLPLGSQMLNIICLS